MDGTITYRHNTMTVQSIDTFLNIKGGYHNGLRDVYFIRALGELPNMKAVVEDIDRKMDLAAESNRLFYRRISSFPKLVQREDIAFYSKTYTSWNNGNDICLRTQISNQLFRECLSLATQNTLEKYKKSKVNCSETMIRNYAAKLWFWCDSFLGDFLNQWNERISIKIIVNDVTTVQGYLFLYMLTLLGCDVLILNNKADIRGAKELTALSYPLKLGAYGQTEIPEYKAIEKKPIAKKKERISATSSQNRQASKPTTGQPCVPSKNITTRTTVNSSAAPVVPIASNAIKDTSGTNQEKSFEELAQLASSIVMIAVHDQRGEPVATGSGIMIGENGFILTNHHVVKAGRIYAVRIEDDEEVYVTDEIVKYNPDFDLAIIRINRKLKPLRVFDGRKKLVRGQKVVAIGSPLGLFNSVSDGIISGFRDIKGVDMIQFTAPISHGSSGGAVLNMCGEVIGISTAGIDSGQNINLAVNHETIRLFAKGFF